MVKAKAAMDLDIVGVLEGTDKSSSVTWGWDYLRHYQDLFMPWKDLPINLIEIGVLGGQSLNVWRTYFSLAQIIGVDINPKCVELTRDRATVLIGSQEDPGFLHQICTKYPPTIFIDDGSHQANHIVFTFEHVFPAILPGGLYVIEDTEFHTERHAGRWAGDRSVSVFDYFLQLARDRMDNGYVKKLTWGREKYFAENIDAITFIGGAIAIRKRIQRNTQAALDFGRQYLSGISATSEHYARLAEYILRHDGPSEQAADLGRDATRFAEAVPAAYSVLARILEQRNSLQEAAEVAAAALAKWPTDESFLRLLAAVQRRRNRPQESVAALQKAVALNPTAPILRYDLSHAHEAAGDLARALEEASRALSTSVGHPFHAQAQSRLNQLQARAGASG